MPASTSVAAVVAMPEAIEKLSATVREAVLHTAQV